MKKILKIAGALLALLVLVAMGALLWAGSATKTVLSKTFDVHTADVVRPWPLSDGDLAELRAERAPAPADTPDEADGEPEEAPDPLAGVDLHALALERAVARGEHLARVRYACVECHGPDFSGGTMIDAPPIGTILGPNITGGPGSRVGEWSMVDWDRKVRHGVGPDGTGGFMPSEDYAAMSDRELSDLVSYIDSVPDVDNAVPEPTYGPVGKMLVATGQLVLSAEKFASLTDHVVEPPPSAPNAAFGAHLVNVCTGCHRAGLEGGPIVGGDPSWAAASNLTGGDGGVLDSYDAASFDRAMRTGVKPDGSPIVAPMTLMMPYLAQWTDTEMTALWEYLKTIPPKATGT